MRVRLVGWNVQPIVMADDGENLTPLQVNVQLIPAAEWAEWKDGGDIDALTQVEVQVAAQLAQDAVPAPAQPNRATRRSNGKAKSAGSG